MNSSEKEKDREEKKEKDKEDRKKQKEIEKEKRKQLEQSEPSEKEKDKEERKKQKEIDKEKRKQLELSGVKQSEPQKPTEEDKLIMLEKEKEEKKKQKEKEKENRKLLDPLNLPEEMRVKYQELVDQRSFRVDQRLINVKKIDYEKIAPTLILEPRVSKVDKIIKFQNKLKEADGHFKKKLQETVLQEVKLLNLQKFISEIVQLIVDSQLNNTKFLVELSSNLYQTYADFLPSLLVQVSKHIEQIDLKQGSFENEAERAKKRKNIARFIGEIQSAGMLQDKKEQYINIIQQLVLPQPAAASNSIDFFIINQKVAINYLQYFAYEMFNSQTYQQRQDIQQFPGLAQFFLDNDLITDYQKTLLKDFFLQKYIPKMKLFMKQVYQRIEEITLQTITEFGEDVKAKEAKEQFNKLKDGYKTILDCLGLYDPNTPIESDEGKIFDLSNKDMEAFKDIAEGDPFELEEEKLLYLQLVDLKELVPKEILKREKEAIKQNQMTGGRDEIQLTEEFFKRFKDCISQEIADELSVNFCYINTKKNRKNLIEEMCVYRNNYILLAPFQSRLVANISRQFKELEEECTKYMLEQYKQIRASDAQAFNKRQRFVRYICELTKFKVMRQDIVMDVFQSFLDDLISQNIELLVMLIESCGRFLLRSNESYRKFKFQLEQLGKLRGSKPLSQQLDNQLENALNSLNLNAQLSLRPQKVKSQLQKYIKYLLFEQLNWDQFDVIHKELLKLPYQKAECHTYLYKYLIKMSIKGRYSQLDLAAGIIGVFKLHYPILAGQIVDHVLEQIQLGLEDNQFNLRQKRLSLVKYLGEFYNFKIIELDLLFNVLYQFIEYGHDSDVQRHLQDLIDPPDDTFRVTQVIVLVESVKEFIKKFKNKLIRFLAFFQRYTLSKSYIPQTVEFNILDMYEMVDPNLKNIKTIKQAETFCTLILDQEVIQKTFDYEAELKKMFVSVVEVDNTYQLLENKQREEELQELENQKILNQEFDQQYNRAMAESQQEARQKKPVTTQPLKRVLSKPIQKGNTVTKVLQRNVEVVKEQNGGKKQQKRDQQQELMQFINFNQQPNPNVKSQKQ